MRALVLTDQLRFDPDYPTPVPVTGEAILCVTHAGICNTDIELTKGYLGFRGVIGHEFVGIVASICDLDGRVHSSGDSEMVRESDRVTTRICD